MKNWQKIVLTGIIILAAIYCFAQVFLNLRGKDILAKKLEGLLHKKAVFASFNVSPLFNFEITGLNIDGLVKAERMLISPSKTFLLTGNLALNRLMIIRPEFTFERKLAQSAPSSLKGVSGKTAPALPATEDKVKKQPLPLILKRLDIRGGTFNFIDSTSGPTVLKVAIRDMNFYLNNAYVFPSSAIANFSLKGKIPWQNGRKEGTIDAEGWINLIKKDIQATLKVSDIDGIALYPYYSNWVDLEKARIQSATLNFSSEIQGLNNNATAECHLELTDIIRKPRPPEEAQEKAERIADAVLDIFKGFDQGRIVLDFIIRTKMDRPEFGFGNIKIAFENKLSKARNGKFKPEDVLSLPTKFLEGTVKGMADVSKAVINGSFAVGNELKKAVETSFKKEPQEPEDAKKEN